MTRVCLERRSPFNGDLASYPVRNINGNVGDHWCVCAGRWLEAYEDGMAPPVRLEACEQSALEVIPLELLQEHASAAA